MIIFHYYAASLTRFASDYAGFFDTPLFSSFFISPLMFFAIFRHFAMPRHYAPLAFFFFSLIFFH